MLLRTIYDENLAHASYLVGCPASGEALIIDPSRDIDIYIERARQHDLRITAVTETHIHADFLSGARALAEKTGATLYLSSGGGSDWSYRWIGETTAEIVLLNDQDRFSVGGAGVECWHTPGHTPEHVVFLVRDVAAGVEEPMGVFSGDCVFVGDLGRPDLLESAAGYTGVKESSAEDLAASAQRFLGLPDWSQIWPAHGAGSACGKDLGAVPQTTVGYERRHNGALRASEDTASFVREILSGQPEPPLYFARMKVQNRDGVPRLARLPEPQQVRADAIDPAGRVWIDLRCWEDFSAGHLPGSLYAPHGSGFHGVAGSYVSPEDRIGLIVDEKTLDAAIRALVRIGLDRIEAWATPAVLLERSDLVVTEEIDIESFAAVQRSSPESHSLLDVRRAAECAGGMIGDAIQVAHTRLPEGLSRISRDKPVWVYCAAGHRSAYAVAYLEREGFRAVNVRGGYAAWLNTREAAGEIG